MSRFEHKLDLISENIPLGFKVERVSSSFDNSQVAILVSSIEEDKTKEVEKKLIYGEKIIAEWKDGDASKPVKWYLSPSGRLIAIVSSQAGGGSKLILRGLEFDGHSVLSSGKSCIKNFLWMKPSVQFSLTEFVPAWSVSVQGKGHYFIGGMDVTSLFEWSDEAFGPIHFKDLAAKKTYKVYPDGRKILFANALVEVTDVNFFTKSIELGCRLEREHPEKYIEERCSYDRKSLRIKHRGKLHPAFNFIDHSSSGPKYVYNRDHSRVGYVGVKKGRTEKFASPLLEKFYKWSIGDSLESWLVWFLKLPFKIINLILRNELLPIGHIFFESGERRFVVDGGKVWRHSHGWARVKFYTPKGNLVVLAGQDSSANQKSVVVVGDIFGPEFDDIQNIRYSESGLSYVGLQDGKVYRVSVKC